MEGLNPCKCGKMPELVDDRVEFFVRCADCHIVVKGASFRHLDHITADTDEESDRLSDAAFKAVDWYYVRQSAVDVWNATYPSPPRSDGV